MKTKTKLIRSKISDQPIASKANSESIYLTASFCFEKSSDAAKAFSDEEKANVYSRFTNPNNQILEQKLALLEGAENALSFSSGMAALSAYFLSQLKPGDHVVAAYELFGSTIGLLTGLLHKFGIEHTFVKLNDLNAWQNAIKKNTKLFIAECPSNPTLKLLDFENWVKIAQTNNIQTLIDNCIFTPVLQKPLKFGVNTVIHSATKYLEGHGRVIAGAIVGSNQLIDSLFHHLRSTGASLSPFNAWIVAKSLDTVELRIKKQSKNALKVAQFLDNHSKVKTVFYPALKSHPDHALAQKYLKKHFGALVSFEVQNCKKQSNQNLAWQVIDSNHWFSITGNFGDVKSSIIHPATTTHFRIGEQMRKKAGINDGLIRLSVGLEKSEDIVQSLDQALDSLN